MPLTRAQAGVSLIELMIAVVMVSAVVAMLSLLFPKSSRSMVTSRQRLAATNFASSKVEDVKKQPYTYIDVSAVTTPAPPAAWITGGCNCNAVDYTTFPWEAVIPSTGTTYTRYVCVSYVSYNPLTQTWTPQCAGDTGYKNVHVHVSWPSEADTLFIDQESMATRY